MAVNEICRYDVGVGSKYQNAQEMFSNIQRWREQKHTLTQRPFMSVMNGNGKAFGVICSIWDIATNFNIIVIHNSIDYGYFNAGTF